MFETWRLRIKEQSAFQIVPHVASPKKEGSHKSQDRRFRNKKRKEKEGQGRSEIVCFVSYPKEHNKFSKRIDFSQFRFISGPVLAVSKMTTSKFCPNQPVFKKRKIKKFKINHSS